MLHEICFWREGSGDPSWAEYMGEKGGCCSLKNIQKSVKIWIEKWGDDRIFITLGMIQLQGHNDRGYGGVLPR